MRLFLAATLSLVALAAAIRFVGINWDRPYRFHPDERIVTEPAVNVILTGNMQPRPFHGAPAYIYPPLLAEILALECAAFCPTSPQPSATAIEAWVHGAGRVTTALVAVITVALLTMMAYRITGSLPAGVLAGAVLALSPLHAESSRYATTDVMTGLWVLLAAWASVLVAQKGYWRHYVLASVAVAAAAATKYPAGSCCVAVAVAHFLRPGVCNTPREHVKLVIAALGFCASLVVLLPPWLVDWRHLFRGAHEAATWYARGYRGFTSPHPVADALRTLWSVGVGEGATVAILLWLRGPTSRRLLIPIATLIAAYLVVLGAQKLFMARNVLHFVPAAVLLASRGIERVWAAARLWGWAGTTALSIALVFPLATRAASQVRALVTRDSRLEARDWIAMHVERGEKIALANGAGYQLVPLENLGMETRATIQPNLVKLYAEGFRWLVYSDAADLRYTRSPRRFPAEAKRIRRWLQQVEHRAQTMKVFPRLELPAWNLPGSTANMYHHPEIRIYRLAASPRRR
jgi:4-amino-4-deoxy-L-arabinose transferase-like glycosyltransferase